MSDAPFYADIADGPPGGVAHWLTASDGVRIRVGHWALDRAKGTVLIFPGRTEFVEKYGVTAKALQSHGFASLAIDWRGQGIADRLTSNSAKGHVGDFADYQLDVQAVMAHARSLDLPDPYFLIGHSMGGCIGLRALHNGLDVKAAMFSGPMWGIVMSPVLRPLAWGLSELSLWGHFDATLAPGQVLDSYVARTAFDDNTLTNDAAMWDKMQSQLRAHPEMALGGPSLRWVNLSLKEMRRLHKMPSPKTPALTFLGGDETIVDPARVHSRMARWPNGTLRVIEHGKHEMLMDHPAMRDAIIQETAEFFRSNS